MATARPVDSASIGYEGLAVVYLQRLFIADTAEQFAEKTLWRLTNEELMQRITNQARDLVVNRYDWEVIASRFVDVYVDVIGQS